MPANLENSAVAAGQEKSTFIPIPKKGNCSNYHEITLISRCGRTQVRSLGRKDHLEREMATHSNTIDWKTSWTEECGSPWGRKELHMTERLHLLTHMLEK